MKTVWHSIFAVIILISVSCEPDLDFGDGNPPDSITDCYQFKDSETGLPLEGVQVSITYSRPSGVFYYCGTQYTNANGKICCEIESDWAVEAWFASIDGYVWMGCNSSGWPLPDIVLMERSSYYKFEIKNIEPQSASDIIYISYVNVSCSGAVIGIILEGGDIDTTIVKQTREGNHSVTWNATGPNANSGSIQTITEGADTTVVGIEY